MTDPETFDLFTGDDVDTGADEAPDGDELTPDEIAAIRASQAISATSDAQAN